MAFDSRNIFGPAMWLAISVALLILAAVVWFVLVRPVSARSGLGTIVGKTFQPSQPYTRVRSGPRREFWSEEKIQMPDSYLFAIRLDDASEVHYRLDAAAAAEFSIGQRVKVRLEERSIPLLWKRVYVREIAAVKH
jgi:hypothetical protein